MASNRFSLVGYCFDGVVVASLAEFAKKNDTVTYVIDATMWPLLNRSARSAHEQLNIHKPNATKHLTMKVLLPTLNVKHSIIIIIIIIAFNGVAFKRISVFLIECRANGFGHRTNDCHYFICARRSSPSAQLCYVVEMIGMRNRKRVGP